MIKSKSKYSEKELCFKQRLKIDSILNNLGKGDYAYIYLNFFAIFKPNIGNNMKDYLIDMILVIFKNITKKVFF